MPRVSTLSPSKIRKLRELRDPKRPGGALSLRAAAAELGISHQTVRDWEQKARASEQRSRRVRREAAAVEVKAGKLAATRPTALEDVEERASDMRKLLKKLAPAVQREEYPASNYVTLAKYVDDLDRLLVELTPPAPKDPEQDESTRAAERDFMARIERMIEDAESRAQR